MNINHEHQLSPEEAINLSIAKWQLIVDCIKSELPYEPEVTDKFGHLQADCGLCELYWWPVLDERFDAARCYDCPLDMYGENCFLTSSLHYKFLHAPENEVLVAATNMLNKLIEIKNKHTQS